ncbi:MAG: hypothetical protein CRN43_08435 [Candidatus Nephrothrix sp. EaCA]|nr:MAG: hypothetical protein CRN43_08435 [Candidatus Nephrothrix sp. EaCA]
MNNERPVKSKAAGAGKQIMPNLPAPNRGKGKPIAQSHEREPPPRVLWRSANDGQNTHDFFV